jgi:hypothetical protein
MILKLRLFLGSYAVLFGIFAIRFRGQWLVWACASLAVIGCFDNWRIAVLVQNKEPHRYKAEEIRDQGPEVAGYMATYLLPFVTVAEPSGRDLLAYGAFLAVACLVYVRSEMVQINPVMYLLGRRVVSMRTSDGAWVHLITKVVPEVGQAIDAVPLRGEQVMVRAEKRGKA